MTAIQGVHPYETSGETMPSFIYFIDNSSNFIKIGTSSAPEARIEQLQIAAPTKLNLLGSIPGGVLEEKQIHHKFRDLNSYGEWFFAAPSLRAFIKNKISDHGATIRSGLEGGLSKESITELLRTVVATPTGEPVRLGYWSIHDWMEARHAAWKREERAFFDDSTADFVLNMMLDRNVNLFEDFFMPQEQAA